MNEVFNIEDNKNDILNYKCNACGSIFTSNDKINKCLVCGCENFTDISDNETYNSIYVLPFIKNLDEAVNDYRRKVYYNPLIPKIFKSKKTIATFNKAFVVGKLNDIKISGSTNFLASDKVNKTENNYEVLNTVNFDYNHILTCNNSKIGEDTFLEISDYNYDNLVEFDHDLLNQYVIINGSLDDNTVNNKIFSNISKTSLRIIKDNIKHEEKKLNQNGLVANIMDQKKVLVPVYILNVKYGNKDYLYLMNGETGKSLINVTYGIVEIVVVSLLLFGIIFLIAFLVAYFL